MNWCVNNLISSLFPPYSPIRWFFYCRVKESTGCWWALPSHPITRCFPEWLDGVPSGISSWFFHVSTINLSNQLFGEFPNGCSSVPSGVPSFAEHVSTILVKASITRCFSEWLDSVPSGISSWFFHVSTIKLIPKPPNPFTKPIFFQARIIVSAFRYHTFFTTPRYTVFIVIKELPIP